MQKSKTYICQNFRIVFQFIISGIEAEERKPEIIKGTEREREKRGYHVTGRGLNWRRRNPNGLPPPLSTSSMPRSVEDRTPLLSPDVCAEVFIKSMSWAAVMSSNL